MYEKAEDPAWVQERGLNPDYQYYFTNQFKKPVQDLLEPLVNAKDLFPPRVLKALNTEAESVTIKGKSTAELEARKAFLARFAPKVKTSDS